MEAVGINIQKTPNPNAKKFVLTQDVKTSGKVSFSELADCMHIDLARELFLLSNVTQIHMFENIITVTQNGLSEWKALETNAMEIIKRLLPSHDATFMDADEKRRQFLSPEAKYIEEILDRTIRPALRMDGGDIEVVEVDGFVITVRFEGACGSCPSSELGTLESIRYTLREEYHPEIDVITV